MTFNEILKEQQVANPLIAINIVPQSIINSKGFSDGCIESEIKNGKLENLEILIAQEADEVSKIKALFHELGHAKDYKTREKELISMNLQKEAFIRKSEYYAFENSLQEAKKLHENGRVDILTSLVNIIPTRINDKQYTEAVADILKTTLWKECENIINPPKNVVK